MLSASTTKAVFRVNVKPGSPIRTPTTPSSLAVSAIRAREATATTVANVELKTAEKLARKNRNSSSSYIPRENSILIILLFSVAKEITKDRRANWTEKSWA